METEKIYLSIEWNLSRSPPKCYQRKMMFMIAGLQVHFHNHQLKIMLQKLSLLCKEFYSCSFILSNWSFKSLTVIHEWKFKPNSTLFCEEKEHLRKTKKLKAHFLPVTVKDQRESLTQVAITLPWQWACITVAVQTKTAQISGENYPIFLY